MELVEIDMELPSIFYEIERLMNSLKLGKHVQWKIAGGALSNLYLGEQIKDIDIFFEVVFDYIFESNSQEAISKGLSEVFLTEVEIVTEAVHGYSGWFDLPELYRMNYKGYVLEFIPCRIDRLYDFDLRFRQFYFHDLKVFASTGALRDIENKTLTIVNPRSPLSTLARVCRFEQQFGFQLDSKSLPYLLAYCNYSQIEYERFENYVQKCESFGEHVQERMNAVFKMGVKKQTLYSKDTIYFEEGVFPFAPSLEGILFNHLRENFQTGFGLFYDDLETYVDDESPLSMAFEYPLFQEGIEPYVQRVHQLIASYNTPTHRLRLISSGVSTFFNPVPVDEISNNLSLYFGNESIGDLVTYAEEKEDYTYEDLFFTPRLAPMPHLFKAKLVPNYDGYVSIGDILQKNSMILAFDHGLSFRMRKCTNGKYTISGLIESGLSCGELILLKGIGQTLQRNYPELFDFGNPELHGVFSYDGGLYAVEHFFPKVTFSETFLNDQIKQKTSLIRLSEKSE